LQIARDFFSRRARFGIRCYSGHKSRAAGAKRIRLEFGATIPKWPDAARKRIPSFSLENSAERIDDPGDWRRV
jgi:hypothetical protein